MAPGGANGLYVVVVGEGVRVPFFRGGGNPAVYVKKIPDYVVLEYTNNCTPAIRIQIPVGLRWFGPPPIYQDSPPGTSRRNMRVGTSTAAPLPCTAPNSIEICQCAHIPPHEFRDHTSAMHSPHHLVDGVVYHVWHVSAATATWKLEH